MRALSTVAIMTTAEDEHEEHESQIPASPDGATEAPTRLREAGEGIAEAQAWKGDQIAKGWRMLKNALGRHRPGGAGS